MGPDDILSIVTYDDRVTVPWPARRVDGNREALHRIISGIYPGGKHLPFRRPGGRVPPGRGREAQGVPQPGPPPVGRAGQRRRDPPGRASRDGRGHGAAGRLGLDVRRRERFRRGADGGGRGGRRRQLPVSRRPGTDRGGAERRAPIGLEDGSLRGGDHHPPAERLPLRVGRWAANGGARATPTSSGWATFRRASGGRSSRT